MDYFSDVVGYWLRRAHIANAKVFAREFANLDMTMLQFGALIFIGEESGIAQKDLAKKLGTEPSVIVKPLEYLENRDLIERKRTAPDRRVQSLYVTKLGRHMIRDGQNASEKIRSIVLRGFDSAQEKDLIKSMRHLVRNVEEIKS